jgi:hypothetical protein
VKLDVQEPAARQECQPRIDSSFTVFADRYGPSTEVTGLRQSFTASSVAHAISVDRRHGIVTLAPRGTTLRVGGEADEYARIRVIGQGSGLVGTLSCSPDGTVTWRIPTSLRDCACRC